MSMKNIGIVTDTTACVPSDYVRRYGIEVVPVQMIIDSKPYRDGIDITASDFYAKLRLAGKIPTTSSSSPVPYLEAFRSASRTASGILCLTEPSRFAAMLDSAKVAAEMAKNELPGVVIEIIDCTTAAAGLGLVALAAARAAEDNHTLPEIKEIASNIMSRVHLFAALDTLHYLARSGRVPQAAALVNSLLNIKPVFTLDHAEPHTVALPRTMKSAMDRILKLMDETDVKGKSLNVAVFHADVLERAEELRDRISSSFKCREIFITEFTPVMGVHTGPGLIGVSFYAE
jgi:DegV family protein with EDD domain